MYPGQPQSQAGEGEAGYIQSCGAQGTHGIRSDTSRTRALGGNYSAGAITLCDGGQRLSPEVDAERHKNCSGAEATLVHLLGQPCDSQKGDTWHQHTTAYRVGVGARASLSETDASSVNTAQESAATHGPISTGVMSEPSFFRVANCGLLGSLIVR